MDELGPKVDRLADRIKLLTYLSFFTFAALVGMIVGISRAAGNAGPRLKSYADENKYLRDQLMEVRKRNVELESGAKKLEEQIKRP